MKNRIEQFVIRWALRRLKRILRDSPNISYGTLGRYGVEDVSKNDFGETLIVL